jgi:large subunit ribosomal protein L21
MSELQLNHLTAWCEPCIIPFALAPAGRMLGQKTVFPTSPPSGVEAQVCGEVKIGEKMKYAIVESGGKQYKAVEGGFIEVDRLSVEAGQPFELNAVLLLVDGEAIHVGTPTVQGALVKAKIIDHVKGPKLVIFNYRPKKRYRVKTGHRQQYTRMQIESILME